MTEREIFIEALARSAAERPAYLDKICGVDVALRRRLDRLLAVSDQACPLLDAPAVELGQVDSPHRLPPSLESLLGPSPRPEALGRLGHYDVLEVLGRGGCGIVLRALDDKLHRVVAVKVLAPHLAETSPPRQRFLREARAAALVRHEHVVQVYAVEEAPLPYLVMEYIDGESLQHRLDRTGPLEASEVARLGRQLALGLTAAHAKGLIHRDVKPANVLLESGLEPRAKLTDFGLARATDDASLTQSGMLAGTPMYMSPEQARGIEVLDHRTDLFSLGSVLYTMLAGRPPFRAATAFAVLQRVVQDQPRPLEEVIGAVPSGLVHVIRRLMAKNPMDRFATAQEAADALAVCLTEPQQVAWFPQRARRRRLAMAAGLLLAVGGVVGAPFVFRAGSRTGDSPPSLAAASRPVKEPALLDKTSPPPEKASAAPAAASPASEIVVTSTADDGRTGSLRWAVEEANARPGEDTIRFDDLAFADRQTIFLSRGLLRLTDTQRTTIVGPPSGITLSGKKNAGQRAFWCEAAGGGPARVTLRQLAIVDFDMGTGANQRGAALFVGNADVELDQVTMSGCFCNFGGAVANQGWLRVANSTLSGNTATNGAAIHSVNSLTIINSTISGNHSTEGGAVCVVDGSAMVISSTFTANTADRDAGAVQNYENRSQVTLWNTLVAGNQAVTGPDVWGAVTANHCLIGTAEGVTLLTKSGGNILGEPARLGPLAANGGLTETHSLMPGSRAIDAGDEGSIPENLPHDQRGKPRVTGDRIDIGAVEWP